MNDYNEGNLNIVTEEGEEIRIIWYGRSENRNPSELLNPYLRSINESSNNKSIVLDFISLEYMNSSTILPILHFLKKREDEKASTLVIYNESSNWQKTSFSALKDAVRDMKNIIIEGRRPAR